MIGSVQSYGDINHNGLPVDLKTVLFRYIQNQVKVHSLLSPISLCFLWFNINNNTDVLSLTV